MILMSRPLAAAMGFTTSKICACGPGVTPTRMVCVWAVAGSPARARRAARPRVLRCMDNSFGVTGSDVAGPPVEAARQAVAEALHQLHEHDQHDDHGKHHLGHEALI